MIYALIGCTIWILLGIGTVALLWREFGAPRDLYDWLVVLEATALWPFVVYIRIRKRKKK